MTKKDALTVAMNLINDALDATTEDDLTEYVAELEGALGQIKAMIEQTTKDEQRNALRKQDNAVARLVMLSEVKPILHEVLTHTQLGLTAKEVFGEAQSRLPEDFTAQKVQYILLHDMTDEVEVINNGRNAKTYRLKGE